eukprot:5859512-Pyramimonas_sp.AAC.2
MLLSSPPRLGHPLALTVLRPLPQYSGRMPLSSLKCPSSRVMPLHREPPSHGTWHTPGGVTPRGLGFYHEI